MGVTTKVNEHELCETDVQVMRVIEMQRATSPQAIRSFVDVHPKTLHLSIYRIWNKGLILKPVRGLIVDRMAYEHDPWFRERLRDAFGFHYPVRGQGKDTSKKYTRVEYPSNF